MYTYRSDVLHAILTSIPDIPYAIQDRKSQHDMKPISDIWNLESKGSQYQIFETLKAIPCLIIYYLHLNFGQLFDHRHYTPEQQTCLYQALYSYQKVHSWISNFMKHKYCGTTSKTLDSISMMQEPKHSRAKNKQQVPHSCWWNLSSVHV